MEKVAGGFIALALSLSCVVPAHGGMLKCPPDSVKVGDVCIDLYEESVWQIPPSNTALVKKVQLGRVALADLLAAGAVQLGCTAAYPANFPRNGNWTPVPGSSPPSPGIYAVSIAGVLPSTCISWFQAVQACALSGKRLARNEEWQRAAAGTPDPGTDDGSTDCNISTAGNPVNTGSRSNCKSAWGVFDMVGNVSEWVADWGDRAWNCTTWGSGSFGGGDDFSCFGGPGDTGGNPSYSIPGALFRGGGWDDGAGAGVFAVNASGLPWLSSFRFGFRCAR